MLSALEIASLALACASANVWAYMFNVVEVLECPNEAETVRASIPLVISTLALK